MFMATHLILKTVAGAGIAFFSVFFATQSAAEIHEMSSAELRLAVLDDRAIGTRRLIAGIENFTQGDVMEVRAFLVDNVVMYRAMYRGSDGTVRSLIVDATNGHAVSENSSHGAQVASLARQNSSNVRNTAVSKSAANSRNDNSRSNSSSSRNENANSNISGNSNSNNSSNANSNSGRDNNNRGGNGNSGGNGKGQGRNN